MTVLDPPAGSLRQRYPRVRPRLYALLRRVVRFLFARLTRVRVEGLGLCPSGGPAIVVTNHLSFFDGPLVFAVLPLRLRPLVAHELRRRPVGPLLAVAGAIFVHRGRPDRAAMRAILAALADGDCLGVAVEGVRSPDGRLQPGKNGVAYLAAKTGAPLVPVAVWGTERIVPSLLRLRRPEVHLRLGPPIALDAPALDVSRLEDSTRRIMHGLAALLPAHYLPPDRAEPPWRVPPR